MSIFETRVVSQPVAVDAATVYDYARRMENLPNWASGLAAGIEQVGSKWQADSPMGRVTVAMSPVNEFGVLDHEVTLPDGNTVHNALRVTPAGDGSLLSFVVLRLPGVKSEAFEADIAHVTKDLQALAQLLEGKKKPAPRGAG